MIILEQDRLEQNQVGEIVRGGAERSFAQSLICLRFVYS